MRSDAEIRAKIVELLELQGEQKAQQSELLDKKDLAALKFKLVPHHSSRGMVAGLYWALGYEMKDIADLFVDPSVAKTV